jgi:hypothetical protein
MNPPKKSVQAIITVSYSDASDRTVGAFETLFPSFIAYGYNFFGGHNGFGFGLGGPIWPVQKQLQNPRCGRRAT